MATLKYKDENGNYQPIVGLNVQNEVVQTTGNSTTAVMSQKAVSDLIPAQASDSNQLADKDFVNSSVSTATATYKGCYNLVNDLSLTTQASHGQIETALATAVSGTPDNNDYAFVQIPTDDTTPTEIASVERYKFNGTLWSFEYTLNNSGFTAAQWAAVNSNITSGLVTKLNAMGTNSYDSLNGLSALFGMDNSGNYLKIDPSSLASVLGVVKFYYTGAKSYLDANDATEGIIYVTNLNNNPDNGTWYGLITVNFAGEILQFCYRPHTKKLWWRCYSSSWLNWSNWKEL